MPDRSRPPSSSEADFTLDLDQVFARPSEPVVTPRKEPEAPSRNHYKLEKKTEGTGKQFGRFIKPSTASVLQAPPVALPAVDAPGQEPPAVFGKRKGQKDLPELTPNRAYEVMKASSLLDAEEMFDHNRFNRGLKILGLVLMVALGVFLAVKLVKSSDSLITEKVVADNPATAQEARITAAKQVLQTYLNTKSWKERQNLIINSEQLGGKFRAFYEDQKGMDPVVKIAGDGRPQELGGQFWMTFNLVEALTNRQIAARLQETPKGFRLDWENFVGLGAMPWASFCATRPTEPTQMRVELVPVESYSGSYTDAKIFRSYELRQRSGPPVLLGYAERASRIGQTLEKALAGATQPVMMNLYLAFDESGDTKQVKIIDTVADTVR